MHLFAIASQDVIKSRLDTCNICDNLKLGICAKCGCLVELKTRLNVAVCPIEKW
jgi:hypothetical protein